MKFWKEMHHLGYFCQTPTTLQPENIQIFVRQFFEMEAEKIYFLDFFPLTFSEMSAVELDASEISVQGSVAAGFEKMRAGNSLSPHPTPKLQILWYFCLRGLARTPMHIPSASPVLPVPVGSEAGMWGPLPLLLLCQHLIIYDLRLVKLMFCHYPGSSTLGMV